MPVSDRLHREPHASWSHWNSRAQLLIEDIVSKIEQQEETATNE